VAFFPLACAIAWRLWRDEESLEVAYLALCKAILRCHEPSILKTCLSMRIRRDVKRARSRASRLAARFFTNAELGTRPARNPPDEVELPAHLATVAQLRSERLPRREVARKLGIPRRLVKEREEAIRHYLEK
jgi:hypothetical protein